MDSSTDLESPWPGDLHQTRPRMKPLGGPDGRSGPIDCRMSCPPATGIPNVQADAVRRLRRIS